MDSAKYDVQTDTKLHADVGGEQIVRYIRANVLRPSARIRDVASGRSCTLADHPAFARYFAPEVESPTKSGASDGRGRRIGLIAASILVPGLGQALRGERKKGSLFFVIAVITLYGAGIASVAAGLDLYLATSEPGWARGDRRAVARNFAWAMSVLLGGAAMWALVLGPAAPWTGGVRLAAPTTPSVVAPAQAPPPRMECATPDAPCEVNGVAGRCVADGWCMAAGPGCIHDVDCEDGNPCTEDACRGGACALIPTPGACALGDEPGACREGICEEAAGAACVEDADCSAARNGCAAARCSPAGRCELEDLPDGESCATTARAPGVCAAGICELDRAAAAARREINCRRLRYYGRVLERCDTSLRYLLPLEDQREVREAIRARIREQMRYDVLVSLIELPGGGYNIVTTNLGDRDEVQGLVDPSFVAFTMASYTKGTGWKSRQLQIWVTPYGEGWAIPTSGSRIAVEKGRSKSILGAYGVVDIEAYRSWLQKNFYKLTGPEGYRAAARSARDDQARHMRSEVIAPPTDD